MKHALISAISAAAVLLGVSTVSADTIVCPGNTIASPPATTASACAPVAGLVAPVAAGTVIWTCTVQPTIWQGALNATGLSAGYAVNYSGGNTFTISNTTVIATPQALASPGSIVTTP